MINIHQLIRTKNETIRYVLSNATCYGEISTDVFP